MAESRTPKPKDATNNTTVLVSAARDGDRLALERLFERYLPRVRQIVAVRMGKRLRAIAEVEDLVQDAMVKVLQGLGSYEPRSEGSFRSWLARCVQNAIVDRAREQEAAKRGAGKLRRFADLGSTRLSDSVFAGKDPTASAILRGKEFEERLEEALLGLEEHQREIIVLRYLCEMPYEEVASAMGFQEVTSARRACARAVHKLLAVLES